MLQDEQNIWHIFFSLLFCGVIFAGYWLLMLRGGMPQTIPLFDALLLALAAFRLVRLFVYDHITQFVRDLFLEVRPALQEGGELVREKPAVGPRRTMATLLGCPWCFGIWAGFTVTFFYFLTPHAWFFILALALGGVASLLQVLANLIGWSAELKKRTVEGPGGGPRSGTCG